jgi:integrase
MKANLNVKSVVSIKLPPGKKELVVRDDKISGFQLRIRAGGSRTLTFQYRLGKQDRRMKLGDAVPEAFPAVRERAANLQLQVNAGQDPAAMKVAAIAAAQQDAANSFKAKAEEYLKRQAKRVRPSTLTENTRYLMKVAEKLHKQQIASITEQNIKDLLASTEANVTKGTGASTANRLRDVLFAMFKWCKVKPNPVADVEKHKENSRDRVLSIAELVEIWRALPNDHFGKAMKLLMLTGARRDEVGGMRWDELTDDLWTLPAARSKNKLVHLVPLSEPARVILSQCYQVVGRDCLFSSANGIAHWGHCKADLDGKLPHIPKWVIHDIRRSVVTAMAGKPLSVKPHVIERIVNHISGAKSKVAGIYNRYDYLDEKTEALEAWGKHLMAQVNGSVVVPLKIHA